MVLQSPPTSAPLQANRSFLLRGKFCLVEVTSQHNRIAVKGKMGQLSSQMSCMLWLAAFVREDEKLSFDTLFSHAGLALRTIPRSWMVYTDAASCASSTTTTYPAAAMGRGSTTPGIPDSTDGLEDGGVLGAQHVRSRPFAEDSEAAARDVTYMSDLAYDSDCDAPLQKLLIPIDWGWPSQELRAGTHFAVGEMMDKGKLLLFTHGDAICVMARSIVHLTNRTDSTINTVRGTFVAGWC